MHSFSSPLNHFFPQGTRGNVTTTGHRAQYVIWPHFCQTNKYTRLSTINASTNIFLHYNIFFGGNTVGTVHVLEFFLYNFLFNITTCNFRGTVETYGITTLSTKLPNPSLKQVQNLFWGKKQFKRDLQF